MWRACSSLANPQRGRGSSCSGALVGKENPWHLESLFLLFYEAKPHSTLVQTVKFACEVEAVLASIVLAHTVAFFIGSYLIPDGAVTARKMRAWQRTGRSSRKS